MTIRANVKAIRREILLECLGDDKPTTRRIQDESVLALINGMTSDQCRAYMRNYAKTDAELKRLMGEDGTGGDTTKQKARAYLIANGTCGTETVTKFEIGVTDVLDQ
jgi:hypothetical protein